MNFSTADPNNVMEADPLAIILGFAGFTAQQSNKIRADGFDQLDNMGNQYARRARHQRSR